MAIRWLAVLCAWALIAEFTLSLPEGEYPEELDLDGPVGKMKIFVPKNDAVGSLQTVCK